MKFKIDENLPAETAELLRTGGFDAFTVLEQKLGGATDRSLHDVCKTEERVLITLDMDFTDIRAYPPGSGPGVIVLRLRRQDRSHVMAIMEQLVEVLTEASPDRELWIVEEDRIRIRSQH